MFMGFISCTRLKEWEGVLDCNADVSTLNSRVFTALQDSISAETLRLGTIEHTAF